MNLDLVLWLSVEIHLAPMLNGARWCVEAAFGESKIDLLVDTGASVSVLHSKIYQKMQIPPKLVPTSFKLFGVSGAKVKLLGQAQFCFVLGEKEYTWSFVVGEMSSESGILGLDFQMATDSYLGRRWESS